MAFRVWAGPALLQNTPPCWAQSLLGTCGWSLSCLLRASSVGAKVPQDHFAAPRPELEYWFASLQLPAIVAGRLEPTTQVGDLVGVPRFGTSASSSVFQIHKYRSKFSFKICALGSVYRNISIFFFCYNESVSAQVRYHPASNTHKSKTFNLSEEMVCSPFQKTNTGTAKETFS